MKRFIPVLASFGVVAFLACGGDGGTGPGDQPAAIASIQVTAGQDTLTALGQTVQLGAVARDAGGIPIPDVVFDWSSGDAAIASVDGGGLVEAVGNGSTLITASAGGVTGEAALAVIQRVELVTVTPASATLTTVGATQQFEAAAADANGNAVADVPFVWASEDHTVATVDANGLATAKGSGEIAITVTAQDVPAHAALVVDQAIDHLAFLSQPTNATAGEPLDPALQVEVRDAAGRRVADAGIPITLSLGANPGGGTLAGTKTVNAIDGVASFSGLWIDRAASGYAIAASATGPAAATSDAFDIGPAGPAGIGFLEPPGPETAGEPLGVVVAVLDEFGNVVPGATADITIQLASAPGSGELIGTTQVSTVGGVARFDAVSIQVSGSGYVLGAQAGALGGDQSDPFQVVAAAPDHLAPHTKELEAGGRARDVMEHLDFEVLDAFGNLVDTSTVQVALLVYEATFPATVTGDKVENAVGGVVVFDSVFIDRPGEYVATTYTTGIADTARDVSVMLIPFESGVGSAGGAHTCVGTLYGPFCWGANDQGQLGDPATAAAGDSVPDPVATAMAFERLSAGAAHTCGYSPGQPAYCWGDDARGQLGDGGAAADQAAPVLVAGGLSFVHVSAGDAHTCGIATDGFAYCWGANDAGQLGIGATGADVGAPVQVTDSLTFNTIAAGAAHTCAWATDASVYCWGANDHGQLGDGNLGTPSTSPVLVQGGHLFSWIDAGADHTCGIDDFGQVFCWGANGAGQLGDGTTTDADAPVLATLVTSDDPAYPFWFRVTAGAAHSCVIKGPEDGIWCWGSDASGQSGGSGGTVISGTQSIPWTWVDAGADHTCAYADDRDGLLEPPASLTSYGEGLYCWGANGSGQLGLGNTLFDAGSPTRVYQGY